MFAFLSIIRGGVNRIPLRLALSKTESLNRGLDQPERHGGAHIKVGETA